MEDDNKRNYLSPLCFYLSKSLALPVSSSMTTFTEFKKELIDLERLKGTIEAVEDLMKNNMHVLPKGLNTSLLYYISILREFLTRVSAISQIISETGEKEKGTRVPKGFLEGFAKLQRTFDGMTTSLLTSIYAYMKFDVSPKQEPIKIDEKAREIDEILDAMQAGLVSKNSEIDTK